MVVSQRQRPAVDPVALLTREHELILDQLRMIETIVGPQGMGPSRRGNHVLTEPDRRTLRELLRFFTSRVGVHFKREAVLITALGRTLRRNRQEREWLDNLLEEHRAMKADAAGIAKCLAGKPERTARTKGDDVCGLRSFLRRYRGHISCEERILYVLAEKRLTDEQKLRVSHRMLQV